MDRSTEGSEEERGSSTLDLERLAEAFPHVFELVRAKLLPGDRFRLSCTSSTLRSAVHAQPPTVKLRSAHGVDSPYSLNGTDLTAFADADSLFAGKSIARFARKVGLPATKRSLYTACVAGHLEAVSYVHEHLNVPLDKWCSAFAARGGKLHTLKYLKNRGCEFDEHSSSAAAAFDNLKCLQYLKYIGSPWNWRVTAAAASNGATDCLKWAAELGAPLGSKMCSTAAAGGSVETLKVVRKQLRLPWGPSALCEAARYGNYEALAWMVANGCPLSNTVTAVSACSGQRSCLKLLLSSGCPCDDSACIAACARGHLDCFEELLCFGCSCAVNDCISACGDESKHQKIKCIFNEHCIAC